jgi:hypothetical protein
MAGSSGNTSEKHWDKKSAKELVGVMAGSMAT